MTTTDPDREAGKIDEEGRIHFDCPDCEHESVHLTFVMGLWHVFWHYYGHARE